MRAIILREPRRLELVDVPRPKLTAPEHVLIKVQACGICGSDLRYYAGENPWALHTLGRHVDNPANMTLGHEYAGVVVEVNDRRNEHLLGQRVGAQAFRTCGVCGLCRSGHENLCRNTLHIGHAQGWGTVDFYPGAYADFCLAWADLLHPMADHVSFEEEALRDFLGVAVHAAGLAGLQEGVAVREDATVLCIGGGPVGLSIAQVARARGVRRIVVTEPAPVAQAVIARYPDLTCLDPTQDDVIAALGRASCLAVFDTVGTPDTVADGLAALAEAGTYVNLAVHDTSLTLNAMALGSERRMTTSSNALYRDEREAHQLIASGAVAMAPMITHRFPLDAFAEAYALLLAEPKRAYKVVFQAEN
ncbi:MAG: alcohol dehydrogenase catalytic domain-containing protein [Anaerolineae bacterium]|jgi:threonine dehydrogenase-like Zn-dependent dehydrogenase|nr:alcohol dehydrogenase catalytic domain-containing protein [Anaerolineae bacterium]